MLFRISKRISLNNFNRRTITVLNKDANREYLFIPGALTYLDTFISKHKNYHKELLSERNKNTTYDFRKDTQWIREDSTWSGASIPDDLKCRHVEITGPSSNSKMVINALNSPADCYMTDIEDSLSPTWDNIQNAHHNIYQSIRGDLVHGDKKIEAHTPTLLVRTRGLHMDEHNVLDDNGDPVPAMLLDLGLHMYHNSKLLSQGDGFTTGGVYFYIPKIESYEEAQYVNTLFNELQEMSALPIGTIRATLLIETYPAIFQTEEIIYALKDHIVGLNCGRWDYIFSFIKSNLDNSNAVLPNRNMLTMDVPFLKNYLRQIVKSCHNRNIHAMGGMSALLPDKSQKKNEDILNRIEYDKQIEIDEGCDGAWVAHPFLIEQVKNQFVLNLHGGDNQIQSSINKDIVITKDTLTKLSSDLVSYSNYTKANIHNNISVSLQYLYSWLQGNGAVAINGVMEDMATCEISLFQLKQWLDHQVYYRVGESYNRFTVPLFLQYLDEEYKVNLVKENIDINKMRVCKKLMKDYVLDKEVQFLVDKADAYLHHRHNFKGIQMPLNGLNRLSGSQSLTGLELTKHRGDYLTDFMYHSSEQNPYYQFLGTTTGISAVNVVAGGQGKIGPYVGGWQINAMSNRLHETLPDTLHVSPEEPGNAAVELNNHLKSADEIQYLNQQNGIQNKDVNYYDLAMLADLEQGWSNPEKVRQSVKNSIMNGINIIHIEDQGIYKRCGHLGDKELAPLHDYKMILKAANYAAQELLGVEQSVHQWVRFVARTDALSAKRIMYSSLLEDKAHPDHPFIDWDRGYTDDGKYLYLKEGINPETGNEWGLDLSITRCTEVVKDGLASHVWMETPNADLQVAKTFLETVNDNLSQFDKQAYGLYNHSPSFDWDVKFYEEALPLANSILTFVETKLYHTDDNRHTKVDRLKKYISEAGNHVQGDHLFNDETVVKILYACYDHIQGYDSTQIMNKLKSSSTIMDASLEESHYLDSCIDLLKANTKSPLEHICDEIVSHRLKKFEPMLASFGFNAHLVTLPEYHVIAYNMYELANDFKTNGIYSYVNQVQRPERIRYENSKDYTNYKHQTATGTGLEAEFNALVGSSNSKILSGSTETDDDTKRNTFLK